MSTIEYDLTHLVSDFDEEIKTIKQNSLELVDLYFAFISAVEAGKDTVKLRPAFTERSGLVGKILDQETEFSTEKIWVLVNSGMDGMMHAALMYKQLKDLVVSGTELPENLEAPVACKLFELFTLYMLPGEIIGNYLKNYQHTTLNVPVDSSIANRFGPNNIREKVDTILKNQNLFSETRSELKKIISAGFHYKVSSLGFAGYVKQMFRGAP